MTDTLIITSSLNPVLEVSGVKNAKPIERLFQLCCSLLLWRDEANIRNIILCDNTDPKFDFSPILKLLKSKGKRSEILTFSSDRGKVAKKGKGYGEGEILRYILMKSELIQQCESFYKVTGRLYIKNFKLLHLLHSNSTRVFDNPIPAYRRFAKRIAVIYNPDSRHGIGMVSTVFYKCDKRFFINNLMERNEIVEDKLRFYIEHAFFYPLIRNGFVAFKEKPIIVGLWGKSGELYQEGIDYSTQIKAQAKDLANACIR